MRNFTPRRSGHLTVSAVHFVSGIHPPFYMTARHPRPENSRPHPCIHSSPLDEGRKSSESCRGIGFADYDMRDSRYSCEGAIVNDNQLENFTPYPLHTEAPPRFDAS
jgi:hypothetical protein